MGYAVAITVVDAAGANASTAAGAMADEAVEGVVVIAPSEAAAVSIRAMPRGVPVVAVEASFDESVPVVAVDQFTGARLATDHLLDLGHRTVWHVAGPSDWAEATERVEGWRASLSAAGIATPPVLRGDWSPASGHRAAQDLVTRPDVTAVFVANDQMAVGLLNGLHGHGVRVPEDISIVGFDDIPESAFFIPPLTTVCQDFDAVGRLGVALLMDLINGVQGAQHVHQRIVPTLTVRASTAPPPGSRRPGP